MEFRKLVGSCCLGLLAAVALSRAEPGQRGVQDRAAAKTEDRQAVAQSPREGDKGRSGFNAVLLDDGYWAIAGVVGLDKDESGRTVIEVKRDGDFDRDMVLMFPVQVIHLESGEPAIADIVGVAFASDALTPYLEEDSGGGIAAAAQCYWSGTLHCTDVDCGAWCEEYLDEDTWRCRCGSIVIT